MTCSFYENRINPNDPYSDLADYYNAYTGSYYAGKYDLEHMPEPPGEKYIYTVYDDNPRFVTGPASTFLQKPLGEYYLSQQAAGQLTTSICVDHGQWEKYPSGQPNPFFTDPDYTYTTRTDNVAEDSVLDIGYHYRRTVHELNEYLLVTEVLTLNGAEGTIDPDCPTGCLYSELSTVRLTADPNEDSIVSWWGGGTEHDGSTGPSWNMPQGQTNNSIAIIADNVVGGTDEIRVTVEFAKRPRHRLTTIVDGAGGSVHAFYPAEPIGGTEDMYYDWQRVKLEAIPEPGYFVKEWTGVNSTWADYTRADVYMYQDREVHVEFITDHVELTVLFDLDYGTVSPRGGRYPYPQPGDDPCEVTLTVSPVSGYRVAGYWENDKWIVWHDNTIDITMDDNKIVEVWFEPVSNFPLIVHVLPSSDGQVHGSVNPTSGLYPEGAVVQLDATPDLGYVARWSGVDSSDLNSAQVTIVGPETIVGVTFAMESHLGDEKICVYSPLPNGEPDWASGPKGCYPTIQDAIDANSTLSGIYGPWVIVGDPDATPLPILDIPESPGDIVVVADGVYTGPGNRDLNFNSKLITVRSEFGPENCIIDPNGTPSEPHRAFYFSSLENNGAVVDGFTIRGGYAEEFGGAFAIGIISRPVINNSYISRARQRMTLPFLRNLQPRLMTTLQLLRMHLISLILVCHPILMM